MKDPFWHVNRLEDGAVETGSHLITLCGTQETERTADEARLSQSPLPLREGDGQQVPITFPDRHASWVPGIQT